MSFLGTPCSRVFALRVETTPTASISVWDIEREYCAEVASVSGEAASRGRWALAAVADFDVGQAVVATKSRTLQLWDLRAPGAPVATSEPSQIAVSCMLVDWAHPMLVRLVA